MTRLLTALALAVALAAAPSAQPATTTFLTAHVGATAPLPSAVASDGKATATVRVPSTASRPAPRAAQPLQVQVRLRATLQSAPADLVERIAALAEQPNVDVMGIDYAEHLSAEPIPATEPVATLEATFRFASLADWRAWRAADATRDLLSALSRSGQLTTSLEARP